jgi:putative thioredoxin
MSNEITDFTTDVLERSKTLPVLVDFWAEWCGPCKALGPILERLAERNRERWVLAKVNTDVHQDLATRYGVRGIPNVKLFINGAVASQFTGALPERQVERWLEKALPHRHRKDLDAAETMLARGDNAGARAILEGLLSHEPDDEPARVLLAGTVLWDDPGRAVELVAPIEEHSERFPYVEAIRTIASLLRKHEAPETLPEHQVKSLYLKGIAAVARRDFDTAVERFIDVIRQNRTYDDEGARKGVIAAFRILGEEHPITQKHRRAFSSALYS